MASKFPISTNSTLKRSSDDENSHQQQSKKGHWSAVLSTAINDESVRVHKDELCTVINDKYPKVKLLKNRKKFDHSAFF